LHLKTEQGASQLVLLIGFLNNRKVGEKMKTIQQRQKYIQMKNQQHNSITNVYKYQHRLKWLMRYHSLLTELEVTEIKQCVKRGTQ